MREVAAFNYNGLELNNELITMTTLGHNGM